MQPLAAIGYAWLAWLASWTIAALFVNRTVGKPPVREELRSRLMVAAGAALLFWGWDDARGFTGGTGWILFAVVIAGLAFAWWARLHLGRLWSGRVTRKEGHRVVDTGPYALVRHPIYTGVILSAFASGVAERRWLAVVGAVVIAAGFWLRSRLEERFLATELGPAYEAYAQRVSMLIPFGPRTR